MFKYSCKSSLFYQESPPVAVPVRFSTVPDVEKNKCIEAGSCFELQCEVSDPTADVHWYKDETEILTDTGWDIRAEGRLRMLVVQSAEPSHSGLYSCNMLDDSVQFTVDIKGDLRLFEKHVHVVTQSCIYLKLEAN